MITIRRAVIFILISSVAIYSLWQAIAPQFKFQPPNTLVATAIKPSSPLKEFNLTDTNGKPFTAKSLRGYWTLIFFGYMTCPDVCPRTLGIVRDAWNQFPEDKKPVRFVFANITPSPADDQGLREFIINYHPSFIGVTGSTDAIAQLSDQLGIYYERKENKIDHSATLMLIDPQGRLYAIFSPPFTAQDLIADLNVLTKI